MSTVANTWLATGSVLVIGGLAAAGYSLAILPPAPRPILGHRGLKRDIALKRSSLFAAAEPVIRYVAARFAAVSLGRIRAKLERALVRSGDHLGLSVDELIASSAILSGILGAVALGAARWWGGPSGLSAVAASLGALAPSLRVWAVGRKRSKRVTRALPGVIELAAMCMGAGLDFPAAIRRIVKSAPSQEEPIVEELARVLQELDLGQTRRGAMLGFSERVPSDDVRELVNSVVQAEDKGSPLAQVLTIQAHTLRLRRSIAAEESASDAALMLLGPMILIFACIIVLLLGPVLLRAMTGTLGAP